MAANKTRPGFTKAVAGWLENLVTTGYLWCLSIGHSFRSSDGLVAVPLVQQFLGAAFLFLLFPAGMGAEHEPAAQVLCVPYKVSISVLLSVVKAVEGS